MSYAWWCEVHSDRTKRKILDRTGQTVHEKATVQVCDLPET